MGALVGGVGVVVGEEVGGEEVGTLVGVRVGLGVGLGCEPNMLPSSRAPMNTFMSKKKYKIEDMSRTEKGRRREEKERKYTDSGWILARLAKIVVG